MKTKNALLFALAALLAAASCNSGRNALRERIASDTLLNRVEEKALRVVGGGFNAGSHYAEVWIRDFNTFIRLAAQVHPKEVLRENLTRFFEFQGADGNIVDGFVPKTAVNPSYDYIYSPSVPDYAAHKNTVETDQESSLVQAVHKYVRETGDVDFLRTEVGGVSVSGRMEMAMDFLMRHRFDQKHGLLWGATTADWGDVQPEHDLAVLRARTVPDDLQAAPLRATQGLRPGDVVAAVGFPFGIGPSVSVGVISGLRRAFVSPEGKRELHNLIQFDAAANPGNSGGPLITLDGEVIGIVTAILNPTDARTFVGIGFAVPIENAARAAGMSPF